MKKLTLFSIILVFSLNCVAQYDKKISYSLYLIGHSGYFNSNNPSQKAMIQSIIDNDENKKGVVFLGNNVIPSIKDIISDNFENKTLGAIFQSFKSFDGEICVVPGWTDWAYGTAKGKEMIRWEYKSLQKQFESKSFYMPEWGCPGPLEVEINDSLTIILLDTQWWLHPFDTRFGKCDIEEESDIWVWFQDALRRNRNKQVIVAGYHPAISYGEYGGYYPPLKQILGFPVSLYRKYIGARSDLSHPSYKNLSNKLRDVLEEFPNVIYASSHEHNFQYFNKKQVHYVIGGSLAKGKYIKEKKLDKSSRKIGYSRIDFYTDGTVELSFYSEEDPSNPYCSNQLYTYKSENQKQKNNSSINQYFSNKLLSASTHYGASSRKMKWMGENYRKVWAEPIDAKIFNIKEEHGGLEIIKRGGGQQTRSLRLEDQKKHQYSLRSIEKYLEGALPTGIRNTFVIQLLQDNISASNPYAALPVSRLADVAGILHTNPQIVSVPYDENLGEHMEDLGGKLFLYEERPSGNWSEAASFGYSKKIVGTDDVIEKTEEDSKFRVDQQDVLKARLFDTFINDWDRHDDQWRWASFKKKGKTVYRPIPRDRDQAFFINEGIMPKIVSIKWIMPKFQGFAPLTSNMKGLTFNARYFDRAFLTEPDWPDWLEVIKSLKTVLTDSEIEQAMKSFPLEVQVYCADFTSNILKQRRDNLEEMARQHYLTLAHQVNVTGTDESDLFEVIRENDYQTRVSVYDLSKKRRKKYLYYQRVFNTDETEEIRLYGLKKDDLFLLDGAVSKGLKIRIVGGKGKDTILNNSLVNSSGKHLFVYDLKKNTNLQANKDTRNKLTNNRRINNYDRKSFHSDAVTPRVFLGYNPDDGLFVGGGPTFNKYKIHRHNTHGFLANIATVTAAFNIKYNFDSESEIYGIDHHFGFELRAPDYAMNYFGMGNESTRNQQKDKSYYRLRVNQLIVNYALGHRWGKTAFKQPIDGSVDQSEILFGVFLKRSNIEEKQTFFISDLGVNGLDVDDLDEQLFTGFYSQYRYSNLDDKLNPKRGFDLSVTGKQFFQVDNEHDHFLQASADLRAYISFSRNPRTVIAFRAGGMSLLGNYSFLESAMLGGKSNLRGFLANRFYGKHALYQNSEIRFKLMDLSSYILNGELGVLGFYDAGRVWIENENSTKWHNGYGSGIWISPFEMTIFTATYNWSAEEHMLAVSLNFKF